MLALAATLSVAVAAAADAQHRTKPARAGRVVDTERYDETFRKYTKRYFGPAFDWRWFKAQGLAESGMDSTARSRVGARGIMQLMPSTFKAIQTNVPGMTTIDDPEWNIAAGILHDRDMFQTWKGKAADTARHDFMFGSYNAGEGTIRRAQSHAQERSQDYRSWTGIEAVAPEVPRWRWKETIGYVRTIRSNKGKLDEKGRLTK